MLGSDKWLWTISFYDDRYRLLQSQTDNHLGGKDVLTNRYDFSGKVLETKLVHQRPGKPEVPVAQAFTYDHAGRLLETRQSTGQQADETIARQSYNELGQLQSKQLGNNLQQLDYRYTIRGWLTGINDAALSNKKDLFGLELSYDRGFDKEYFNGNISGIRWKSYRDNIQRAYGYHYDSLNRIRQADYRAFEPVSNNWTAGQVQNEGNFDVSGIGYDLNGNILSMQRRGLTGILSGQNQYGPLDKLSYAYQGNKLQAVDDDVVTPENKGDFEDNGKKYNGIKAEVGYDGNGNLKADTNKGITGIAYNHLNLPQLITFRNKGTMEFIYSASGVKLRKIVRETGKPDAVTDYSGGFVYQNDTLAFAHTAEGRVLFRPPNSHSDWVYEYHYKDHLGNTRLAFRRQEHEVKIATLEPSRIADEQQDFDNIVETRSPERSYNGNYSSRLSAAENKPLGPLTMLPVQRGDSLILSAFASYQANGPAGRTWTLAAFVSSLFHATAPPPPGTEGYRHGRYTPYIGLALGASIVALQPELGVPNAYLKYIVLNQDSAYVYSEVQVISSAAGQSWQELKLQYKAEQDGFVQVFVYNESGQEVFFDDITIRKDPALIVQENHYDPWGMNLVGIEMQGRPDHKYQYNGKEKQEELGLGWNDYGARFYDPQLGRWHSVDPLAEEQDQESWSPYHYVYNNPVAHTDPDGRFPTFIVGAIVGAATDYGIQVAANFVQGKDLGDALTDVDGGSIATSAAIGAVTGGLSALKVGQGVLRVADAANDVAQAAKKVDNAVDAVKATESTTNTVKNITKTSEKLSKVEKSKTVEKVGGKFTKTTEMRPGKGAGQSRAEYVRIKNAYGKTIKTYKDSYDKANKFQHRKPLRGGPEGRPQN